jgi:hypothetical protein
MMITLMITCGGIFEKYLAGGQWAVKITMGLVLVALHCRL